MSTNSVFGHAVIHQDEPVVRAGVPLDRAAGAVLLFHGRGASPQAILSLYDALAPDRRDLAVLAPAARNGTWYPYSFLMPTDQNEPYLSSALETAAARIAQVEAAGVPRERIALLGFSQGACLALETAARHASRFGAVVGLSGGLIGPPGTPRTYPGTMDGTPVFLGCSDRDTHIPVGRVHETAEVFRTLGAAVDARLYPGMGHTVNNDEVEAVRALLAAL